MTASLLPWPRAKFFMPNTNYPLSGGKVYTYMAGSSTPQPTYTDSSGSIANTNPVILDANGEANIWLATGASYKIDLYDASNVHVPGFPIDNVTGADFAAFLLTQQLISTTSTTTGAGMIGFDGSKAYASPSIGYFLRYSRPTVQLIRGDTPTAWKLFTPRGVEIDISASTTSGLQEAINYACSNGFDLEVHGGGTTTAGGGADYGLLYCTTTVTLPPLRNMDLTFRGTHLIFQSSLAAADGLVFDSCMMVRFQFNGEIVHLGSGPTIRFKPVSSPGVDPLLNCVDSLFDITTVVASNGAPACVILDITANSLTNSRYSFREINGAGAGTKAVHGIRVTGADSGANREFTGNWITATHIHDVTAAGIQVGVNATNANHYYGNIWDLSAVYTDGASAEPINVFGSNETIRVGSINGNLLYGVTTQSGATNNTISVGRINGNTGIPIHDLGDSNAISYAGKPPRAGVTRGGTNQTGIATATYTKVQFNVEEYDVGSSYDSATNFRWTPGRLGQATIKARVAWTTMITANAMRVAIYKNGALYKQVLESSSGTLGDQGPMIACDVVVSALTDYFEIWARQDTGSTLIIDGSGDLSWAQFEMLP